MIYLNKHLPVFMALALALSFNLSVLVPVCAAEPPNNAHDNNLKETFPERYPDLDGLLKDKKYDEAEAIARKRLSFNPADTAAICALGEVCWQKKDRKSAIKLFRKARKIAPEYPYSYLFLGRAYVFENKYNKAKAQFALFKEKMEILPNLDEKADDYYAEALHYLAYIHYTQKEYEEMMNEYRHIIELKPDDQRAHYNLAVGYYVHYGSRSKAYAELVKVREIDPDSELGKDTEYFIDYMRRNPDARFIEDFSFIYEEK